MGQGKIRTCDCLVRGQTPETTRWVVRMASDRKLAPKQFEFSALQLNECGRMVGGWLKSRGGGLQASGPL